MTRKDSIREYQEIHRVLTQYIEGCVNADSSIMKPSFSPSATIYNVDAEGNMIGGSIQILFDSVDNDLQPSANPQSAIVYIDIEGSAASARIDAENISGIGFTDYMNLLKVGDKWLIISKIFQLHL